MDNYLSEHIATVPLLVLAGVLVLVAMRQVGNVRLQIWQILSGAALLVLVTGSLPFDAAWRSVSLYALPFWLFL